MKKPLKILIVEDNPSDAKLIQLELSKTNKEFESRLVQDEKNFLNKLETFQPDLILSDYDMPQFTGLDALEIAKRKCPEIPFIIVTDTLNEEIAVKCIRWGAWDYVLKDRLVHLGHAVKNTIKLKAENEKKKLTEEALKQSEKDYRDLFNNATDAIYIQDKEGRFLNVNQGAVDMYGYPKEFFIGKTPGFLSAPGKNDMKKIIGFVKDAYNGKPRQYDFWGIRKNGEVFPKIVRSQQGFYLGQKVIITFAIDITERKKAEEALKESEEKFRVISESAIDSIFIKDIHLKYIHVNPAMERLFGLPASNLIGKTDIDLFGEEAGKHVIESDKQVLKGEIIEEFPTKPVDGVIHSFHTIKVPLENSEGKINGLCGIDRDITERKQAEKALRESEKRFQKLLENVPTVAVQGYNPDGIINYWNKANESLYGYTAEEAIGKNLVELIIPPEMRDEVQKIIKHGAKTGEMPPAAELTLMHKDGNPVTVYSSHAVVKQTGREPALFCMDMDLTERKKAEEQIKKDLKEKNVLLQEVHHRVKNNMQVISSLLKLQSGYIKDKKALGFFKNSQNRVRSMALVHESLYRSEDMANIDFAEYVKKLTTQLLSSFATNTNLVKLNINIKDIKLDINLAIPCGLIINELVSNSLKYAFPVGRKGELSISFTFKNQTYILTVKDNGIGIPEEIDLKNPQTLGLLLVDSLTKQLRGSLELERVKGTCFKITFQKTELKTYGKV